MLYVAQSLPDRRRPESEPALHDELERPDHRGRGADPGPVHQLAGHARRGRRPARTGSPFPILAQSDLPKPALVEAFRADEPTCLFATLGFWQGVDVPGPTLSLVTIDRIPFPRPDDPVLEARRERAGPGAFAAVDLPRAGTLLAQGAGRLIRSAEDRGVVAVLDSRLATARYRGALLARVPPMKRTVDRQEVVAFLREITLGSRPAPAAGGPSAARITPVRTDPLATMAASCPTRAHRRRSPGRPVALCGVVPGGERRTAGQRDPGHQSERPLPGRHPGVAGRPDLHRLGADRGRRRDPRPRGGGSRGGRDP